MSLRLKLILTALGIQIAVLASVVIVTVEGTSRTAAVLDGEHVRHLIPTVAAAIATPLIERDRASLREVLGEIVRTGRIEMIVVRDGDGVTLAMLDANQRRPHSSISDYTASHAPGTYRLAKIPIRVAEATIGMVEMVISKRHLIDIEEAASRQGYITAAAAIFVSLLGMALFGYFYTRDLHLLKDAATRVARGDLSTRLAVRSDDEVGHTSRVFNEMLDSLVTAQREIEDGEFRVRNLLNSTAEAIYGLDLDGNCTFVNPAGVKMLGCADEAELLGNSLRDLVRQTKLDDSPDAFEESRIFDPSYQGEDANADHEILWRKDGTSFPVEYWSHPIQRDGEIVGTVVTFFDITERQAMEEQLRRSQRMDAIGQLTGGIAHDFNNLLGVLIGNAEMLEDQVGENEMARHNVKMLISAVNRGAALTNRLLSFSRQQTLAPQPTAINRLVIGLEDMLRRTLGETIELHMHLGSGVSDALIDPQQFENALINLAINARDAMPSGGMLNIETENVTLDETHAEQHDEVAPGDYVMVAVSDTGTGIEPAVLEKVFEPFFTTKDVSEGSGLGLSMVHGFVKQSEGQITIYSEVGHGTTVKLYLPKSRESEHREAAADQEPVLAPGSERILVVEDDDDVREVAVVALRTQNYKVVEANDGNGAIKQLKGGQPFDLLFTDMVLPGGMSGADIANEATRLQPNIKILFTTGYTENTIMRSNRLDPRRTLINKPYRRHELLAKVRTVLDGKVTLS